ncbi:hypothetical protein BZG35_12045 [Brevundimonas sp. LM2]|uniref:hypothetical protein n=1 Tax=Brevundimonas sp. LM2 TaxID=1938605 RepID=UPI000983ADA7|nr:hypothetical protein [Brevundimonas sp. LM2]AQR62294.1 hypothetical protein BZG35_12045 [Brevundimonas sp. LM2]
MTDRPDDPEIPLAPFPFAPAGSPFPPPRPAPVEPLREQVPADPPGDWIAAADAHDRPITEAPRSQTGALIAQPLIALGRFAFPPGPPTDDEGLSARDRRWASRTIVIATGFLLIFNAVSIQNWSRQQAPGWVTTTVRRLADVWVEQISQLGADQPREAVRDGYEAMRDGGRAER